MTLAAKLPLRVLVVEDSLTVRRRICEVLATDAEIEIVGEASDGQRAVELCEALRPDVITMDMMLPVMSGLAATAHIMAHFATPILVVSSSTNRGEVFQTYEALAAGAVDVLEKPGTNDLPGVWEKKFLGALKMVARIAVITHPQAKLAARASASATKLVATSHASQPPRDRKVAFVAIGASTGGPAALVEVLRALAGPLRVPIAFVLHIGDLFAIDFASWLAKQIAHPVTLAEDGLEVVRAAGSIVMAPPRRHLAVQGQVFRLVEGPDRHSCKPSVDVLFESVAREYGASAVACLLTGMGRDGALGLRDVRSLGGLTLAQDEATSVVYGMPREAARIGAASRVLPLGEIGPMLRELCANGGGER